MDDRMLTRLLESSSPSTTESADRDAALNALLDARLPRSRRARSVTAAVAVTGALVLGGTTTAVAVPAVITHLGWLAEASTTQVTADGTTCAHGFRISAMPERPTEAAALDVARTALVSVDLETLDIAESLAELTEEFANAEYVEGGHPWVPTPAFTEQFALYVALSEHVRDAVAEAGFDPDSVALDGASECDGPLTTPVEP